MKKYFRPRYLPVLTLLAGILGMLLRVWLYATGIDDKNLLIQGHPADILVWILTVITVAGLFYLTQPLKGQGGYRSNFPASLPGAIGCWVLAAGLFITALGDLMSGSDRIVMIAGILGVLCVPAMVFAGYSRYCGTRSSFLLYALLSVYYIARMVCQYRLWSADPQLQDYCFQIFACVGLMLTAFQRAAFDVKMGRRRSYAFLSLVTFFFCCLSIPHCEQKLLYLVNAVFLLTNLCSLRPMRRRPAVESPEAPEVPEAAPQAEPIPEEVPAQTPAEPAEPAPLPDFDALLADIMADLEGL